MYCKCTVLLDLKKLWYFIVLTIIKNKFRNTPQFSQILLFLDIRKKGPNDLETCFTLSLLQKLK